MNTSKTLLAILVEELPKRGGWPKGAITARQDADCEICFNGNGIKDDFNYHQLACDAVDDGRTTRLTVVTRDQYEAAMAEGLPEKLEAQRNLTKSPAADADGWIEWHGGECPVPRGTLVDVKHRDGDAGFAKEAGKYGTGKGNAAAVEWDHTHEGGDIIAYRLHKPQDITSRANDDRLAQDVNELGRNLVGEMRPGALSGQLVEDGALVVLRMIDAMQDAQVNLSLNDAFELAETLVDAGYRKQ